MRLQRSLQNLFKSQNGIEKQTFQGLRNSPALMTEFSPIPQRPRPMQPIDFSRSILSTTVNARKIGKISRVTQKKEKRNGTKRTRRFINQRLLAGSPPPTSHRHRPVCVLNCFAAVATIKMYHKLMTLKSGFMQRRGLDAEPHFAPCVSRALGRHQLRV